MVKPRRSIHADDNSDNKHDKKMVPHCDKNSKVNPVETDTDEGPESINEQQSERNDRLHHGSTSLLNLELNRKLLSSKHPNSDQNHRAEKENTVEKIQKISKRVLWIIGPIVLAILLFKCLNLFAADKIIPVNLQNQTESEIIFENELLQLEKTLFSNQEDRVWDVLLSGIKSVIKEYPNKPSAFLMLVDNEEAGITAKDLALEVIKAATKLLMSRVHNPVIIEGSKFDRHDYISDPGKILVDYNETIRENGAMVLTDLQDVPPEVATSFHFLCDRYSPLVEKALYFFILKSTPDSKIKLQKFAEDTLSDLWSSLPANKRDPLITRMTTYVLRIVEGSPTKKYFFQML